MYTWTLELGRQAGLVFKTTHTPARTHARTHTQSSRCKASLPHLDNVAVAPVSYDLDNTWLQSVMTWTTRGYSQL